MINIKISKVFRTLSYEVPCVLVGVRPIRLAIEEKVRTYKINDNNTEYDAPESEILAPPCGITTY